ncbi:hypothetical protein ACIRPH_28340 [Nocardiopsis sp. NPDC101807]|uniref:hypothetical protein n=1 Tax=Nocardiopsis sp. NPDC101807 TaxID=3364339 RepID=UPI0038219860
MAEQRFPSTGRPPVVLTHVRARARRTGRRTGLPVLRTISVEGGLITEVRPFYRDTAAMAGSCAVPGPEV